LEAEHGALQLAAFGGQDISTGMAVMAAVRAHMSNAVKVHLL